MKKKIIIAITLVLVAGIVTAVVLINNKKENENPKLLLVAYSYSFKYAATYDGVAIYDDGTVSILYLSTSRSEYNSYMGSYSINTKSGIEKLYLDKGIKKDLKIPKGDLIKIKNYVNNINSDNVDTTCLGDEKVYSMMYLFNKDRDLRFYTSDCEKNSTNKNVTELLELINQYKKRNSLKSS